MSSSVNVMRSMASVSIDDARSAWIARVHAEKLRLTEWREHLVSAGFFECAECELIDAGDRIYTTDGRIAIRAAGSVWTITEAQHRQLVEAGIEQARQRDAAMSRHQPLQHAPPPPICTSLIDGQICGGSLTLTPVCPNCALGKSGVAATLTCDVCGHVTAIMKDQS